MKFLIKKEYDGLLTDGLIEYGFFEIFLHMVSLDDAKIGELLLQIIGDYIIAKNITITSGEKISFGTWTLQLREKDGNTLSVYEYSLKNDNYVEGASFAMDLWKRQELLCEKYHATCIRPTLDQLVVVSDGVFEGESIEGTRYNSPEHMSGWWLITNRYNGDHKTLKKQHLVHVLEHRPELDGLLALPYGFQFNTDRHDVWFDKNVGAQA